MEDSSNHLVPPILLQSQPLEPGSAGFLSQLLNAVQEAMIAVDRAGHILFWNDAATALYGYSREEALGRDVCEITANGNRAASESIMSIVWAGSAWAGEIPVTRRDSTTVIARVRLFPVRDGAGEVVSIIGVSADISQEVAARDALRASQERVELLAQSTSDAIWEWEAETDKLWANRAYIDLVGPPEAGKNHMEAWLARVHPADRPALTAQTVAAQAGGDSFVNEYRILSAKKAAYTRVVERSFCIRDESGKLLRVVGGMSDISQLKEAEQAVHTSEERFRRVFEESPLGIIIVDHHFLIQQANRAFCRMIDHPADEVVGRPFLDFTHPDDQAACAQIASELFVSEHPYFQLEKRYLRRDGGVIWSAVTASSIPGRNGESPLGLALIEDISEDVRIRSELTQAKARAENAMAAKMRFLAQISHEIRSPMNGVLGMLELLDASPLTAEQRENCTAARQAATSLLGMLEEVLDLTRLDQHRLALHPRPYSPGRLVDALASLYRGKISEKGVQFFAALSSSVPEQHVADPARVRQILVNLLENAVKFTGSGHISLLVSGAPRQLHFTVEDTGLGIPADSVDTVFESFSAISGHTSASVGGTGLGLAISKRLANLMGGDLTVTSVLGEGSRFTLLLPMPDGVVVAATPAVADHRPAAFPGRRILVVEDNLINQRVAAGFLRRLGCEVDLAADGVEGLRKALSRSYDAILMDAMMPIMDGFEATVELRRRERSDVHVPVIGLTALATEEDRNRCLASGMDDYLPKPADFASLSTVLSRWIPAIGG
jgi:PAS domain S-box-containing protein